MADTIAAIATGTQVSAIGIIRLSGDETFRVIDRLFFPYSGKKMSESADRRLIFGELRDRGGELLDVCLCTISRAPHSYTGENTAELQCHGSPTVLRAALDELFALGARQAAPGEFTKRAFLNGRMELCAAEAVADIIDAETVECAKNAAGQLSGAISRKVDGIYSALTDISSHYHAVLDYPDEDIEDFQLESYEGSLTSALTELERLLQSHERGKLMTGGIPAAIAGRPNAGKSSLLNALLGYDRAIVTAIPGTTRDTIEEKLRIGRLTLRLIDTAGIRDTEDVIEKIGVDRSVEAAKDCDAALFVVDDSRPLTDEDRRAMDAALEAPEAIAVLNKQDLGAVIEPSDLPFSYIVPVSCKDGTGFDLLEQAFDMLFPDDAPCDGSLLTNARQADAIVRAKKSVDAALRSLRAGFTPDAVLVDLEAAMRALGEVTGRTMREDITNRIFERFCVGK